MLCIKADHLRWDFDKSNFAMIHSSSSPFQLPGAMVTAPQPGGLLCSSAEQQVDQSMPRPSTASTVGVLDHNRRSPETSNKHAILFPTKLRCILDDAVTEGNEHIVSWLPDGKAFKIHNPEAFTKVILRRYFRQTMFKSFTRQLYHYGFSKLNDDLDHNTFSHPQFRRDDFESCLTIDRKKHKTSANAPHVHSLMKEARQVSLTSSSPTYTTSPISVTTMPVHEALLLNEGGSSPLQSPTMLRHDPRAFQQEQQLSFDSRGSIDGCFFEEKKEKSPITFETNKTTTLSSNDWFCRLEGCFPLATEEQEQPQRQRNFIRDDATVEALAILEPRSLEEMMLYPMPIPSITETIHQGQ